MTTQEIVKQLKKHNENFPVSGTLYLNAAERLEALDRALDLAVKERTPHDYGILADQRDEYQRMFSDAVKQVEKERAEVDQLKHALHDARLENSGQAARIEELRAEVERLKLELSCALAAEDRAKKSRDEAWCKAKEAEAEFSIVNQQLTVRPEPSRLEIAAMFAASWVSNPAHDEATVDTQWWLQQADALIAAAKEAK